MKPLLLSLATFLAFTAAASAQDRKQPQKRPVTQKEAPMTVHPDAKNDSRDNGKAREEIEKRRAEKRAKMEKARKDVREKIAADTTAKR